ncbi:unnamed protein product [Urochloa humidicola]
MAGMLLLSPRPVVGPGKRPRWGFTSPRSCGSSSDERWDLHKRVKSTEEEELQSVKSSSEEEKKVTVVQSNNKLYAGPGFQSAPPNPSELPVPPAWFPECTAEPERAPCATGLDALLS